MFSLALISIVQLIVSVLISIKIKKIISIDKKDIKLLHTYPLLIFSRNILHLIKLLKKRKEKLKSGFLLLHHICFKN